MSSTSTLLAIRLAVAEFPTVLCSILLGSVVLSPIGMMPAAASAQTEPEVIELIPDKSASWTPVNLFGFVHGPGWYEEREILVETTPPGAQLDLFYVRANFQKAYEQAESPVIVRLPSRNKAGKRDSMTVRAMLDGHRQREVSVKVRSGETKMMIDLSPLPNTLVALSHTYFGGRGTLTFLTRQALTFRLQNRGDGFAVVLTETGASPQALETIEGVHSAIVAGLRPQQLGEDLVVSVELSDGAREKVEPRSRQAHDPVRGLHSFALDLTPKDGGAGAVESALAALARIRTSDVTGCSLVFDEALRRDLEPAALSRALTPRGTYTDRYMRAAMKRLGEVSPGGVISLGDGTKYDPSAQIELSAATSQAAQARGYLALLRRFVAELEPAPYRRETLRGLVAPELSPARFDAAMSSAEMRESKCRATG